MSGGKSQEIVIYRSGQLGAIADELRYWSDFLTELQQKAGTKQRGYAGNIKVFFIIFCIGCLLMRMLRSFGVWMRSLLIL